MLAKNANLLTPWTGWYRSGYTMAAREMKARSAARGERAK